MITRVVVLVALLWYALAPSVHRTAGVEGPSLRAPRSAIGDATAVVRSASREASRAPRGAAIPPAIPSSLDAFIPPASFVRLPAPVLVSNVDPDPEPLSPVARGPPREELLRS